MNGSYACAAEPVPARLCPKVGGLSTVDGGTLYMLGIPLRIRSRSYIEIVLIPPVLHEERSQRVSERERARSCAPADARAFAHPAKNSARPARRVLTACWTCQSHASATRLSMKKRSRQGQHRAPSLQMQAKRNRTYLSHHCPHSLPSRFLAWQEPKSSERPMTMMESALSGVNDKMLAFGLALPAGPYWVPRPVSVDRAAHALPSR